MVCGKKVPHLVCSNFFDEFFNHFKKKKSFEENFEEKKAFNSFSKE